jgi:hypothetical protein
MFCHMSQWESDYWAGDAVGFLLSQPPTPTLTFHVHLSRFVLADTEKLHQKIAQMSDRIRQLEDALTILQSTLSSQPHPLLSRELMKIKSSIELHAAVDEGMLQSQSIGRGGNGANGIKQEGDGTEEEEGESVIDSFGTLAIRDDGAATFYGRSAGSEVSFFVLACAV